MENVFISEDHSNNCIRARKYENAGQWEEARVLRKFMGQTEDVKAIDLILESTRLGNRYRELTKQAFEDYELRHINIYELNVALRKAHAEVYNQSN